MRYYSNKATYAGRKILLKKHPWEIIQCYFIKQPIEGHTLQQAPINELYEIFPSLIPLLLASCRISKAVSTIRACPATSINVLRNICLA